MTKPEVIVFTPTVEESRIIVAGLDEVEFDSFSLRVVVTGPGRNNTKTVVEETAAPLMAGREKPLLLIGTGRARPLEGGLKPGETAASGSVFLKDGENKQTLEASAPLVKAVIDRLAAKGFRPGRILEEGSGQDRFPPECLAADSESAGLALAASGLSPEPPWLNLRVAAAASGADLETEDYLEALALKLLVALSTIDRTPPPSSCSGCRNPCGFLS